MNTPFIFADHLWEIVVTAFLSMVPTFEGRYAVVSGQAMGLPVVFTFILALIFSTLPMPFIFWLLKPILRWLYSLPFRPLRRFAAWVERRSLKKSQKINSAELLTLFVFVAIPLPGTGVWTGSAIATLLNMKKGPAMLAIFLGNLAACLIMLLAAFGVSSIF